MDQEAGTGRLEAALAGDRVALMDFARSAGWKPGRMAALRRGDAAALKAAQDAILAHLGRSMGQDGPEADEPTQEEAERGLEAILEQYGPPNPFPPRMRVDWLTRNVTWY